MTFMIMFKSKLDFCQFYSWQRVSAFGKTIVRHLKTRPSCSIYITTGSRRLMCSSLRVVFMLPLLCRFYIDLVSKTAKFSHRVKLFLTLTVACTLSLCISGPCTVLQVC